MGRLWRDGQTPGNVTTGGGQEVGTAFVPLKDGVATHILYYRSSGSSAITSGRLWAAGNATALATATLPSGDQTDQGWQTMPLDAPINVSGGVTYIASVTWTSGVSQRYDNPISPFNGAEFQRYFEAFNSTAGSLPTGSGYQGEVRAVDVLVDFGAPAGATAGEVSNALTDWLDTVEGTQAHSAPLLTYQEATSLDHGFAKLAEGLNRVLNQTGDVIAAAGNTVAEAWDLTLRAFGLHGAPIDSSVSKADGTKAIDVLLDLAPLAGAEGRILALQRDFVPLPGAGWELADETDFTREIAWAVPADAYSLVVTSYPIIHDEIDVAGVTWLPRLGWWAPLNGTQGRDRRFINFSENQLDDWPRRLPGVVIRLDAQVEAHLQAWTFTPAS